MRLPVGLYSTDQLSELVMELRSYINQLHDTVVRRRVKLTEDVETPGMSVLLKEVFELNIGDGSSPDDLLRELENLLKHAPVVHIVLAALPGRELRRQLTLWFRTQVGANTMLTFSQRHDIGGGIIVRAGSQVFDYSFRHLILDSKHRIVEIFTSVR